MTTYLFQRRTAGRAEDVARSERLRQELITAYSGYAGAVTELKRAKITLWFRRRHEPRDHEALLAAHIDSDRLGAAVETAAFRLQLVADDPELRRLMEGISEKLSEITRAADPQVLIAIERRFEDAVRTFITEASTRLP
ncbi:hypothetical protein ACIQUQ_35195 [Streptomyces sp. NPDC101118]|uniref:hypothetical protein n=1 Tax=Streptomyces sp. NPDC101118 TaxID=3366109 RepID=UPI0038111A3E